MKKLVFFKIIFVVFFSFFVNKTVLAGPCDTTISTATTSQLLCADSDSLTVTSDGSIAYDDQNAVEAQKHDNVTITNRGTIKTTTDGSDGDSAIKGQSSLNLTVINSGTIWAREDYGIKLIEAEKITITNEAGGIIKTSPDDNGSEIAIGGKLMGNCGTCLNGSTTSSGEGLTLHNYGTIDAYEDTVFGGQADSQISKKTKIYNYDGGTINATKTAAIRFMYAEDFELYNYEGATIQTQEHSYGVDLSGSASVPATDVIIDNAGTISSANSLALDLENASTISVTNSGTISAVENYGVFCMGCVNLTLTNSGEISANTIAVSARNVTGTNTITNSGTLTATNSTKTVDLRNATGVTLENSGTISATSNAIFADNAFSPTITNSGTITSSAASGISINLSQNDGTNLGTDATITNSGTIEALGTGSDGISIGDGTGVYNDVTITNSGTIKGLDNSIRIDGSGTTGTNIITKGEAVYTGEIDMEDAVVTMTLDCSISNDTDIEIHNKTNMTVTNNLCGNDTYAILDDSKDADADNSATNGYLRILGEDLDTPNENAKYRGENVLTKLRGLFTAADHINWNAPEEKFFKIFHSYQKREGIYDGSMSGVVGQLNPFNWGNLRSNVFVGYTKQYGDFSNGEYLGGDNFALGLKNVYENNGFTASFTPMFGFNDLTITDYETDSKTSISSNILSEFAGINTKIAKEVELSKEGTLDLSIQTTYGVQKFPDYIAKFVDGDLSVDESIEQVLGVGFAVKYSDDIGKGFIIQPYAGVNINNNFNDKIKITADSENNDKSPAHSETSGYYAGVSLTKEVKGMDFDLNLMYGNEDGLINQIAAVSFTKSFGKAKAKTAALEKKPDFPKVDESLTTQDYSKDLNELEFLKDLNKKLKADNAVLKTQNEKLKLLAEKVLQQDKAKEKLVIELLKENEKIKLNNQIFKNRILDNENEALLRSIEEEAKKSESNKFELLYFLALYIVTVLLLTSLFTSFYKKIRYRSSRQTVIS